MPVYECNKVDGLVSVTSSNNWKYVGDAFSWYGCVEACIERRKVNDQVDGVSRHKANKKCYCYSKMTRIYSSSTYNACILRLRDPGKVLIYFLKIN